MPVSNLFEIRDLICSYNGDKDNAVLKIPHLDIPRGEIVFLLGASGSGKSTLLEAMGLMNNTVVSGDISFLPEAGKNISYTKIWQAGNSEALSDVRRSYLSFIFQNTNLMDNFSVYENICLSSMIQQGVQQSEAQESAKTLMAKIGLPVNEVPTATLAKHLSGGQRQRVAFARALNPEPSVLFGDEPTGNLDEKNANELMKTIRGNLGQDSSAIVVSHDIRLALNHADRIICFSKPGNGQPSLIKESDIFKRTQWSHLNELELDGFINRLKGYYHVNLENTAPAAEVMVADEDTDIGYKKLFLKKEGRALLGHAYSNLLRLIGIITTTLLAIGFANGSLHYLDRKLNDPFVNWLTINIPSMRLGEVHSLMENMNAPEFKERYKIGSVVSYTEAPLFFFKKDGSKQEYVSGRSIACNDRNRDPMINDLLQQKNLVKGGSTGFQGKTDLSVIVTENFMSRFGYDIDDAVVNLAVAFQSDESHSFYLSVPVGVRAVVREMPGNAEVAYEEYFIIAHNETFGSPLDIRSKTDLKLLVFGDSTLANEVLKATKLFLRNTDRYRQYDPSATNFNINSETYREAYEILIGFWPAPEDTKVVDELFADLLASAELNPFAASIQRFYNFSDYDGRLGTNVNYDLLSANFKSLDKVRDFAIELNRYNDEHHIRKGTVIQADLAKIREKENFNFLSAVARVISVLVVIFGIISVSMFIANLLRNHLSKIQMNIGTFKAFGLGDRQAQRIYFVIVLRFILVGLVISTLLALGGGIFIQLVLSEFMPVEEGVHFFRLIDMNTLLPVAVVILFGIYISWRTINKMLNKSPGDLIYNR